MAGLVSFDTHSETAAIANGIDKTANKANSYLRDLLTLPDVKRLACRSIDPFARIVNYRLCTYAEEKLGFLGSHFQLQLIVRKEGEAKLTTVTYFVKALPHNVPAQANYIVEKGVFEQEADYFQCVIPQLLSHFDGERWAPECYVVKKDVLIFEDLRPKGFSMRGTQFNRETLTAALSAIARMHAASILAETRLGKPLNELFPRACRENAFSGSGKCHEWFCAGVDTIVAIAKQLGLNHEIVPATCQQIFEAVKPSRTKRNVFSHGDLWGNNLMFDDSQETKCFLVDFQLVRYAPLAHDISQLLYLTTTRKYRETYESVMIDHYYTELYKTLKHNNPEINPPPLSEILKGIEEQRLGSLITAAVYFPTVLLDGKIGARIMNNPDSYEVFVFQDRRESVLAIMEQDSYYKNRITEVVEELVELGERIKDLPQPC